MNPRRLGAFIPYALAAGGLIHLAAGIGAFLFDLSNPSEPTPVGMVTISSFIAGSGLTGLGLMCLLKLDGTFPIYARVAAWLGIAICWTATYLLFPFLGLGAPVLAISCIVLGGTIARRREDRLIGWSLALSQLPPFLALGTLQRWFYPALFTSVGLTTLVTSVYIWRHQTQLSEVSSKFLKVAAGLAGLFLVSVLAIGLFIYTNTVLVPCTGLNVYPDDRLNAVDSLAGQLLEVNGISGVSYSGPPIDPDEAIAVWVDEGTTDAQLVAIRDEMRKLPGVARVGPCQDEEFPWL